MNHASPPFSSGPRLRWVSDVMPGIRRHGSKNGFTYVDPMGRKVQDPAELERIRLLAVPPAYKDVWICPLSNGHLQATGRDARDRKQYRYHPRWQVQRSQTKFASLTHFAQGLVRIRARIKRELASGNSPTQSRVLAALVHLLDTTWARIGNDAYEQQNGSYGLTTLHNRHSRIKGSELQLSFIGKSGIQQKLSMQNDRVVRLVRRCRELPGQRLFQYLDDSGDVHAVNSSDVNAWLLETSGEAITAKDFRTWHASVLALQLLTTARSGTAEGGYPLSLTAVVAAVAARLGNTPSVCRKSYIHPAVLALGESMTGEDSAEAPQPQAWLKAPVRKHGLRPAERQLLSFLTARDGKPKLAETRRHRNRRSP
ncbi:DNA topoisomerase IB [Variovorax sp. HJSM1_2]|uniref:DNA topoisomerase IB n=1 Tax=Variovorax sp. HJSM1_2 TaxID=3366263 RepID=UPI003BE58BF2